MMEAWQPSKLSDEVRLLGGALTENDRLKKPVLGVWRIARDPAKVEDQVRFLARTLPEDAATI